MSFPRIISARRAGGLSSLACLLALAALTLLALLPAQGAYPGEPTVTVAVAPGEITVDASGSNPVDTVFKVNVTGNNNFAVRPHTMWVNMSFSTSGGWAVSPSIANLTLALPAMGSTTGSVSVTVTVPPGMSANEVTL